MNHLNSAHSQRRLRLLITLSVIAVVVFAIRLADFQIVKAEAINEISYEKRAVTRVLPAVRGDILDSQGNILATTVFRYDINAAPAMVKPVERKIDGIDQVLSVESIAAELASLLDLEVDELLPKLIGTSHYVNLKKRVDANTYRKIEALEIPWIYTDAHQDRLYPSGAVAGNLLGFVGDDGEALAGIERQFNSCLAGIPGEETFEKGVDGIKIPSSTRIVREAKPGRNVVLTIDADLQYQAQQILAGEVKRLDADWAVAVALEVETGKIILAAEAPSVDPNNPGKVDAEHRGAKVFQFAYEPGSTMKGITAATAIDTGFATIDTKVVAPYTIKVFDKVIKDIYVHGKERWTLAGVLEHSSNTGTILIAQDIPRVVRYDYMKRFGLGKPTEVGFEGETSGLLNDYRDWDGITDKTTMFGQALSVSPIQLASAYQALANDGVRLSPSLVAGCQNAKGEMTSVPKLKSTKVVSKRTAEDVVLIMEKVVENSTIGKATAVPGYRTAGKSGTAEIIENGKYGNYFAGSFFGMAPAENPKYVLGVMVYKPKKLFFTSQAAASPYQRIMSKILLANRVEPSTTKSPEVASDW